MRNLLNFLIRYSGWFVFALYVLLSLVLLVQDNVYRQSVYLTSANNVTGAVYGSWSNVTGYFHLKGINERLQASNAELQNDVLNLRHELSEMRALCGDSVSATDRKSVV